MKNDNRIHLIATFVAESIKDDYTTKNTMKYSLKFILAFLLLMLSFSMSGNAMNFSTCILNGSSCQLSELSSGSSNQRSSVKSQSVSYDNVRSLSISDVELGLKLVTESNSTNYRLRRIIEINDSLRDIMQKFFLLRENSLVLGLSKTFYSDKDPHYSIICSDYYVFALRRILI